VRTAGSARPGRSDHRKKKKKKGRVNIIVSKGGDSPPWAMSLADPRTTGRKEGGKKEKGKGLAKPGSIFSPLFSLLLTRTPGEGRKGGDTMLKAHLPRP